MAYVFGDGFDCYAAVGDAMAGYWDSGATTSLTLVAGRFSGSQALQSAATSTVHLVKSSAINDAVHHIVMAFRQTVVLSGTNAGLYLQFVDASTNQCCIVFRSDGAILLTSATPAGTTLATYTGAVSAQNTWFAFEFEVVIHPTAGAFRVRKNGNTSNDFDSGATLNTRPGTNSYANKLQVGMQIGSSATAQFDDLLWRSDASSVAWVGDVRCYTRMPATTVSAQFTATPNPYPVTGAISTSVSDPTGTSRYTSLVLPATGTVGSIAVQINTGFTGNLKCSIFADASGNPGAVLGSATTLANPVTGANTMIFGTPVAVTKGTQYWLGISHDVTASLSVIIGATGRTVTTVTYAAFPTSAPTIAANSNGVATTVNITPTSNADFVSEAQQDGATTYVYDSNAGDADFYTVAALAGTPASTIAVTTRGFFEKSDAGTRNGAVQLKSGATTVTSTSTALSTNFGWLWRADTVDPATGAAWTATGVNNAQIGPVVTA